MNKKKGFTLIELLAVIAILAILAIIITPIVTSSISKSKKSGFERSIDGLVDAALTDYASNGYISTVTYTLAGNSFTSSEKSSEKIKINGSIENGHGVIIVRKDGDYSISISNDDYSVYKEYTDDTLDFGSSDQAKDLPQSIIENWTDAKYFTVTDSVINTYTGEDKDVIIPKVINGITISQIGNSDADQAFANKKLDSVIIPNTINNIYMESFENNNLTSLVIPSSVMSIGDRAFAGNQISELIVNDSARGVALSMEAFASNNISKLNLNNITSVQPDTFRDNPIEIIDLGCTSDNENVIKTVATNAATLKTVYNGLGDSYNWQCLLFNENCDIFTYASEGKFTSSNGRTVTVIDTTKTGTSVCE